MLISVEQLDEAHRSIGWNIEYRQISKGGFLGSLSSVESQPYRLASVRFSGHLEIQGESPAGFMAFHFGRFETGRMTAWGHELTDGDIVAFPPGSEIQYRSRGEIHNETLFVQKTAFEAACQSIAPRSKLLCDDFPSIHHCNPARYIGIRRKMREYVTKGTLHEEDASWLVAAMIFLVGDAHSQTSRENPGNGYATVIARRARTYIEDHLDETIRLDELSSDIGVGRRTLQRCFSTQYQISPMEYINARRMNRARRELVSANPARSSVTRIALDNGFSHLGRFSVDYRSYFGESPRQTLASNSV